MLAEEQQAEEQLAEELLAEDLETVKYFSKIFRDIYEAQDTCKETSKRKMMVKKFLLLCIIKSIFLIFYRKLHTKP